MDSMVKVYLERAENEAIIADSLMGLSQEKQARELLGIPEGMTFYSAVISHAYYAIFYSAKAILLTRRITTSSPDIHKKTFELFKKRLVDTGMLDVKLLEIYKAMAVRADELLEIFKGEKRKRGIFTYATIPQANREPAAESIKNSKVFVSNILRVLSR